VNNTLTKAEQAHVRKIKSMDCGVCGTPGPSDAHHIEQHMQYLCIPLCRNCHMGSANGIHGRKQMWKVMKKSELSVLNETIRMLLK
jgi:hypothetical protein